MIIAEDIARRRGNKTVWIARRSDDDFMPTVAEYCERALKRSGIDIVGQAYKSDTKDFSSLLAEGRNANADSFVFLGYEEIGLAMKQARAMGIKDPFFSLSIVLDPKTQMLSDGAMEGVRFANFTEQDGNPAEAAAFLKHYAVKFSRQPTIPWTAFQAYDAARIVLSHLSGITQNSAEFPARLRAAMLQTKDFRGVSGNISIQPDGSSRGVDWKMYVLKNNRPKKLD